MIPDADKLARYDDLANLVEELHDENMQLRRAIKDAKPEVTIAEAFCCGAESRDAEIAELMAALEDCIEWLQCDHDGQAKSRNNAEEALTKVRKPT